MAQYKLTHKCGHPGSIALIGTASKSKDWHINRAENSECDTCAARTREAENKLASEAAAEVAAKAGLPTLVGSEKQIAWAETIRLHFIETKSQHIREMAQQAIDRGPGAGMAFSPEQAAIIRDGIEAAIVLAASETSARVWIDSRNLTVIDTYRAYCAPLKALVVAAATPEQMAKAEAIKAAKASA